VGYTNEQAPIGAGALVNSQYPATVADMATTEHVTLLAEVIEEIGCGGTEL
jgi:hypothetical protein